MKSTVSMATIVGNRSLTKEGSVKRTLEVEISLEVTLAQFDSLSSVWSSFPLCVCMYMSQVHQAAKMPVT